MRFNLIDRIVELTPREHIVAVKAVSTAEEYLADHFPTFPVLPGVLMLQGLVEAASWLVREALDFQPTIILLKSVKNLTYKSFVKPGDVLQLQVTCRRLTADDGDFEGAGRCQETEVLKGRFTLAHFRLTDRVPGGDGSDDRIRSAARALFDSLRA